MAAAAGWEDFTRLLGDLQRGDRAALDRLFELVYEELRRLARKQLPHNRGGGETLNTTALVHEVYLKFTRATAVSALDRQHFFSLAARAMRQILVDHARGRAAARRPDPRAARPLDDTEIAAPDVGDVLEMDSALQALEQLDPGLGRLVEWRVFAGLTLEEIADFDGRSISTLKREWQKARAFLHRRLSEGR